MIFLETQLVPSNRKTAGLTVFWYWDTLRNSAKWVSYNAKLNSLSIVGSVLKYFHCIHYHCMHLP